MSEPAAKTPVWPAFVAFLAALTLVLGTSIVVFGIAALVWASSGAPLPDGELEFAQTLIARPAVFLTSTAATVLSLLGVALAAAWLETRSVAARLRLSAVPHSWKIIGAGTLALIASGQIAESLAAWLQLGRDSSLAALTRVAMESSTAAFVGLLLIGSVGAGVAEELLFRGYLQPQLVARWGRWPGILIASALFGAIHMDALHSTLAFGIGIGLGWIADRFGSTRPTIAIHLLNNLTAFWLARWGVLVPGDPSGHLMLAAGSVPVALAGWWLLARVPASAGGPPDFADLPGPAAPSR